MTGQKPAIFRIGVLSVLVTISLSGCSTISNLWGDKNQASQGEPTALPETNQSQQWYCYPEDAKSWDCVDQEDTSKIVPIRPLLAKAEADRSASAPAPAVAPAIPVTPVVPETTSMAAPETVAEPQVPAAHSGE